MIVFKSAADMHDFTVKAAAKGSRTGFVPTMGALHSGHISLINNAARYNNLVICSIFVNPTQFNDSKDFERYPVTIERDIDQLEAAGCDVLFLPPVAEMYPNGTGRTRDYDLGYLETVLEGKFRPGHFQGVCQVVHRLLEIIPADNLYLGQKDYQQCMVLSKMVELTGLHTRIGIVPTLRETDGLAMSSRNMRLNEQERQQAIAISRELYRLKENLRPGDLHSLQKSAIDNLAADGFKVDYVEMANADTLELLEHWDGKTPLVALVAAFLHEVRLIDNMILTD
jgi:pantoate--beta-alanine ligase